MTSVRKGCRAASAARGGAQKQPVQMLRSSACLSRLPFLKTWAFYIMLPAFYVTCKVLWKGTGVSGWKMPSHFLLDMCQWCPSFQATAASGDEIIAVAPSCLPPPLSHCDLVLETLIQNVAERGLISSFAAGDLDVYLSWVSQPAGYRLS